MFCGKFILFGTAWKCVCLHFVMNKGPSTNAIAMKCAASQRCRCLCTNIYTYVRTTRYTSVHSICGYATHTLTHSRSTAYVLQLFILPALCISIDAFTNTCIYIHTHSHMYRRSFISLCTHNGFTCLLTA